MNTTLSKIPKLTDEVTYWVTYKFKNIANEIMNSLKSVFLAGLTWRLISGSLSCTSAGETGGKYLSTSGNLIK